MEYSPVIHQTWGGHETLFYHWLVPGFIAHCVFFLAGTLEHVAACIDSTPQGELGNEPKLGFQFSVL